MLPSGASTPTSFTAGVTQAQVSAVSWGDTTSPRGHGRIREGSTCPRQSSPH